MPGIKMSGIGPRTYGGVVGVYSLASNPLPT